MPTFLRWKVWANNAERHDGRDPQSLEEGTWRGWA